MKSQELDIDQVGERLDKFLARRLPGTSRGFFRDLIDRGKVTVNAKSSKADYRIKDGDRVRLDAGREEWPELDLERWVLYEDNQLIVLNKPTGLLMHPLGGTWLDQPEAAATDAQQNLAGVLLRQRPKIVGAGTPRCGIVHRLDRPTSGVLLVAKTPAAYHTLVAGFAGREIQKTYRAVVLGEPSKKLIAVDAPVGRQPGRRRMEVLAWGRPSQTDFKVLESAGGTSLIEAQPKSGRTHQIRVHLADVGLAVLGDPEAIRAMEKKKIAELRIPEPPRLMLHAYRLRLEHPRTKKPVSFTSPPPQDFKDYWALLRARR